MKLLILGDIHGRLCWLDIINKEKPDKVIFMGDYVSTHDKDISSDQQCSNLEDILNYKEQNNTSTILLRANHDNQHLGYSWAECSGYFPEVAEWMSGIKERFLSLTQWIHIEDFIVFSHAGISNTWFKSLNLGEPTRENLLKINTLEPSEKFAFTPERYGDFYGDSKTQPCTWIRPQALLSDPIPGWTQVVGHTAPKYPGELISHLPEHLKMEYNTMPGLWCVDTLPNWYMVIDEGKKEMRRYVSKV